MTAKKSGLRDTGNAGKLGDIAEGYGAFSSIDKNGKSSKSKGSKKDAKVLGVEKKIEAQFADYIKVSDGETAPSSIEYEQFKAENSPGPSSYFDKFCLYFGKLPSFNPGKEFTKKLDGALATCHMTAKSSDVVAFALYGTVLLTILIGMLMFIATRDDIMMLLGVVVGVLLFFPLLRYPLFLAEIWRMKAGNQMVLAVFYVVTYMRHTSNLERAIEFASDHIGGPLSLDFKKLLWDVETQTYQSIESALDVYLSQWKHSNPEFIESMHLIQGSLLEESDIKRLETLDKSLDIILNGTYEKMLHYAHNLQTPITTLHMLGVILPILGLVILPLMIAFMPEVEWYHVALFYNVVIPIAVYWLGMRILSKRPSGYSGATIDENNPELLRRKKKGVSIFGITIDVNPYIISAIVIVLFVVAGFFPIWILWLQSDFDVGFGQEIAPDQGCGYTYCLLDYQIDTNPDSPKFTQTIGPYGLGASLISLLVPLGLGVGLAIFFALTSLNVIEIRRETEQLEAEFGSALFQLGNRLDDGLPAESAVGTVSESLSDSVSGNFFRIVYSNMQRLGISLQESIFNKQIGALVYYPSNLIESSMKVLIESVRKGPKIGAQALANISRYLKEMHMVNERLQDLMAEVLASMRSQIGFLTPIIAGIVIGITSMITNILSQLSDVTGAVGDSAGAGGLGIDVSTLFSQGLPTFYFQIIVGIYVVQITIILSILINGIKNGVDPLEEKYLLAHNLARSVVFYVVVAGLTMFIFNIIAASILQASFG